MEQITNHTHIASLFDQGLKLENGQILPGIQVAYETYGRLNDAGDNAILVCHALTGDAHAAGYTRLDADICQKIPFYRSKKETDTGWWDGLIGPGKTMDTNRYFIISSNILGSCYGTTGPVQVIKGFTGANFPAISIRDMVKVQKALLEQLEVSQLVTVIGGSLGGMQALEWALMFPEIVCSIIPIATAAAHTPWAISYSHLMRQAIYMDPVFNDGHYDVQPENGLSLARQIGMLSYRTSNSFEKRFGRNKQFINGKNVFEAESYLTYQGEKLVNRFDANCLLTLLNAMDEHDVGHGRGGVQKALSSIQCPALCLGIDSDLLYPAQEQREISSAIPGAHYREISSIYGHDAFLIEFKQLNHFIHEFLDCLAINKFHISETCDLENEI